MKWVAVFIIILLTVPGMTLPQIDQLAKTGWGACRDTILIESEDSGSPIDKAPWFGTKLIFPVLGLNDGAFFAEDPEILSLSFYQGISAFWRSPPCV